MSTEFENNFLLKLETDEPSESSRKKALLELRETPENIANGLKELKSLLKGEKDLITPINNDEWLLMFLRTCKFYPESARNLIRIFYATRHKYSEINVLLLPSKIKHVFDDNLVSILPQRDQHGRRIIVAISGRKWNHKAITLEDLFAGATLCLDILQKEPESQIHGVVYILDLEGLSLGQTMKYTPYKVKRALDFVQNHSPLRMKGFHIVNQPKIYEPIFAAIKNFFSPKYSKRIIMHGNNYESLHRYIAPECLPQCYRGKLKCELMYSRETFQLLAEHETLFEDLQKFGMKKEF